MMRITNVIRPLGKRCYIRSFSAGTSTDKGDNASDENNPITRTFRILGNDMKKIRNFFTPFVSASKSTKASDDDGDLQQRLSRFEGTKGQKYFEGDFPTHCDVLVIGGGGVGSSVAYWLKQKARDGLNVVVVEKDPTYKCASTVLSVGGLRQQFSLPENIQMSLFGAEFIRNAREYLGDVDLNFAPYGYLVLASDQGAETLKNNSRLQNELGAKNELLSPEKLKSRFPWINTEGIALGCHGLENEGWFDPWALLCGFKEAAKGYGAHFINGEVCGFEFNNQSDVFVEGAPSTQSEGYNGLEKVVIQMPDGEKRTIKFAVCVLAAGAQSGNIGRLANIGTGPGILSVPVPVEPRKRYVYVFTTQGKPAPGLGTPLTIDPDGTYFRRDGLGGNYICGRSPNSDAEPKCDNLEVDHEYFETDIWPTLAQRVPAFESAKVCSSWAGFYEYNLFDENGIIGPHPYYNNMYVATGFSGHGIQQTPAVGRAISEMIIDGQFRTIDLSRLGFDRILVDKPMFEVNIV